MTRFSCLSLSAELGTCELAYIIPDDTTKGGDGGLLLLLRALYHS